MTPAISLDRLREVVEEFIYRTESGLYISPEFKEKADFASRLLVVEPKWEKAKEVLRKHGQKEVGVGNYICIGCGGLIGLGCAPDCVIAELLRGEE